MDLRGRVAVVTGGASGIGAACAARLRAEGATVVTWDLKGKADIRCDTSSEASVTKAIRATVKRAGTPTLLVAAAGVALNAPILELDVKDWDKTLGVNLRGVMLSLRAVAREAARAKQDGSLVLIASVNGIVADPGLAAYSASKSAVFHLARVAALELGPLGIRVNAIGPGPTDTPMLAPSLAKKGYYEEIIRRTALGRIGTPELVADAVVGLMRMDWVTGQGLMADGGTSLKTARSAWDATIATPKSKGKRK